MYGLEAPIKQKEYDMRISKKKMFTAVFAAAAVTGSISVISSADEIYKDSSGDQFTYVSEFNGITVTGVDDNGDGKITVPGKIEDTSVYSFTSDEEGLTALDTSKCPSLTTLYCASNKLTKLDVSKNTELESLYCDKNQIQKLDLSHNPELRTELFLQPTDGA